MEVLSRPNEYASGGSRFLAFIIDYLLLNVILSGFFWQAFNWPFGFGWSWDILTHNFLSHAIIIIYYALMESSARQATLGKMALGIKVVNYNGQRLDFSKALLRNLSKIISGFILGIGYLMIIFDDRKQGLHDKIADTFVVRQ